MSETQQQKLEELQRENAQLRSRIRRAPSMIVPTRTAVDESAFTQSLEQLKGKAMTVIVVGASGHLARTKTFPALFKLQQYELLPSHTRIVGYARSKLSEDKIRKNITSKLKGEEKEIEEFYQRCTYVSGQYDSDEDFKALNDHCKEVEAKHGGPEANRIFYYAIPPSVFGPTSKSIKNTCMIDSGFNRIIVEKPFGKDSESSAELSKILLSQFDESQIYRIDHYLGKEMVQNLMVLRFANAAFEPLWSRHHIKNVVITFKENKGVEGRGGYFDEFGIIRDVMQNHLLQLFSLVAMEPPVSLDAEDIRNEKVKVLRQTRILTHGDIVTGQYTGTDDQPGYTEDESVPDNSTTPTFAAAVLRVDSPRWKGVPFILKCGKGLNERKAEVRIQFHASPSPLYGQQPHNELVLRVQPNEAIYLKMVQKSPGLSESTQQSELDLSYNDRFGMDLPDAYERLILDVFRGDHRLFVRNDELRYAWKIFTPILHQIDAGDIKPVKYKFGQRSPVEADDLARAVGVIYNSDYKWSKKVPGSNL